MIKHTKQTKKSDKTRWTYVTGYIYIIVHDTQKSRWYTTSISRKTEDGYLTEYIRIYPCKGCDIPEDSGEYNIKGDLSFREYTDNNGNCNRQLCIYAEEITEVLNNNDDISY